MNPENTALLTGLIGPYYSQILSNEYETLHDMAMAPVEEIEAIKNVGPAIASKVKAALGVANGLQTEIPKEKPMLDHPERVAALMRPMIGNRTTETLYVLTLNTRRRLIKANKIADGTLDTIHAHAREIFRCAILQNAAAIVLVHNHPSGEPSPSSADVKITGEIVAAGKLLKIEVVDHVIIGTATQERAKCWSSLRELGHIG